MSDIRLFTGDPLQVGVLLGGGQTDKYVRVSLSDKDDNLLFNSPFTLTHQSNGFYVYDGSVLVFPSTVDYVKAIYSIYDDPFFLIPTVGYGSVIDTWQKDSSSGSTPVTAEKADLDKVVVFKEQSNKVDVTIEDLDVLELTVSPRKIDVLVSNKQEITFEINNNLILEVRDGS